MPEKLATLNEFFSCDWGTTSFRLRRVTFPEGKVLAEIQENAGARALSGQCEAGSASSRDRVFSSFLIERLRSLRPVLDTTQIVISGMASSSIGWRELPYSPAPCPLDGSSVRAEAFDLNWGDGPGARIHLISGISTKNEMMRGEETEILGIFSNGAYPEIAADGIVLLPGTHSKHVRVRDGAVEDFRTYMTGELFDVLATHSILRASVANSGGDFRPPESTAAFVEGVGYSQQPGLPASLFQVRARTVLSGIPPAVNRWFLSGLLIGAEVGSLKSQGSDVPVLLAATDALSELYQLAFQTIGCSGSLVVVQPDEMKLASLRGHRMLLQRWRIA